MLSSWKFICNMRHWLCCGSVWVLLGEYLCSVLCGGILEIVPSKSIAPNSSRFSFGSSCPKRQSLSSILSIRNFVLLLRFLLGPQAQAVSVTTTLPSSPKAAMASTIKAAYAQLQMNRSNLIQFSDLAIVSELRRISELEQSYFRNRLVIPCTVPDSSSGLFAQIEKQRNSNQDAELLESEKKNQFLDSKLHLGSSLSSLDGLQLSGAA
ncbi:hypothetical protein ZIOFF_049844 [Zingiber officinale]|uniref:DUF641 domain-containing protein n=1 Tax=Zingiber officinale TaxID=94328 RepID=A0A8J5KQY8_ZINOF|nr:hypothetical protein ZIOFF_049844 [Zingiber officinale]